MKYNLNYLIAFLFLYFTPSSAAPFALATHDAVINITDTSQTSTYSLWSGIEINFWLRPFYNLVTASDRFLLISDDL
jgi:hypothetical protein